jgi:hypothetical protein
MDTPTRPENTAALLPGPVDTPARVESVALKEEHKIVFDRLAFSGPSPKTSKALTEEEWKRHIRR